MRSLPLFASALLALSASACAADIEADLDAFDVAPADAATDGDGGTLFFAPHAPVAQPNVPPTARPPAPTAEGAPSSPAHANAPSVSQPTHRDPPDTPDTPDTADEEVTADTPASITRRAPETGRPSVEVASGEAHIEGLPAISADGQTIATSIDSESLGDGYEVGVSFAPVRGRRRPTRTVIQGADDFGTPLTLSHDRLGRTVAERARAVETMLAEGGYRTMYRVSVPPNPSSPDSSSDDEWTAPPNAPFTVEPDWDTGRLRVRDEDGRLRFRGRLEREVYECIEDDPSRRRTELQAMYVDQPSGTILIMHGFRYPSCLCPDATWTRIARFNVR